MKRVKYSRILIIGIFIYIIFQVGILIIGKSTSTIVIKKEKVEDKISTKGLFIRDEQLIISDIGGIFTQKVKAGEKVKSGQLLGVVHKDSKEIKENNKEIELLKNEINRLTKDNSNLKNPIVLTQIKTKQEQLKLLESQNEKNTYYIKSSASGIVSYKYDGNENLYNLDRVESVIKEDIENANNHYINTIDNDANIKKDQVVARIINNNESYVAINIGIKEMKKIDKNPNVQIKINDQTLNGRVNEVYQKGDYAIVTLKISDQNVEIYDTRVKEFDIIYKQVEGLKIPKTCVKKVDNTQGVYVINHQTKKIEFVKLENIEYENEDYIYIDDYKNDIEGIETVRVNDEVLLKPNSINTKIRIK